MSEKIQWQQTTKNNKNSKGNKEPCKKQKNNSLIDNYTSILTHRTSGIKKKEEWNEILIELANEYGLSQPYPWDINDTRSEAIKVTAIALAAAELQNNNKH